MSKRVLAVVAFVSPLLGACFVAACGEGAKAPVGPVVIPAPLSGALDGGSEAGRLAPPSTSFDASTATDAATLKFYDCTVDSDCTAVPKVGCCSNGYKEAVNAKFVDAYKASFVCPSPGTECPRAMVDDTRVAECNGDTHACELVEPARIKCGGAGKNPHACPEGKRCVTRAAAGNGACVK